jgi:3-dehydroquinate dehydratase-1
MSGDLTAKICASIAVKDVELLKDHAQKAFSAGADFVEIRFDFIRPEAMPRAIEAIKEFRDKSVFTLRSKAQGGSFAGSEQERIEWLRRLAELRPMLLDVELDTLKDNDDLADFLENHKTAVLVSWHDFQRTPPTEDIADILSEMRVYGNYVKVVTMAQKVEDSIRLLDIYQDTLGLYPVIFAMGEAGVVSRVLCTIVGNAPFTYASVDGAVAPGQLTVGQMRKLYDRMAANRP